MKTIGVSKHKKPQDLILDEPDSFDDVKSSDAKSSLRIKLETEDAMSMRSFKSRQNNRLPSRF